MNIKLESELAEKVVGIKREFEEETFISLKKIKRAADSEPINYLCALTLEIATPLNWFDNTAEFNKISSRISRINGQSVIPQFIKNHTQLIKNKHVCWITWPQTRYQDIDFSLEISLSTVSFKMTPTKNDYHSWLFAEEEFLKLHHYSQPSATLKYFKLSVFEYPVNANTKQLLKKSHKQIMDCWFSMDTEFGELRNIEKGNFLKGQEIMDFFGVLNNFFKIKKTYLCDASRSNHEPERATGQIVFRVLMSIAYGKTWYERYKFFPFTFQNLRHGWPGKEPKLSQDAEEFYAARETLRGMPLSKLREMFLNEAQMLSAENEKEHKKHEVLDYLQSNYAATNTTCTLGELTAKIYDASKGNPNNAQIQDDLKKMYGVLTLPEYFFTKGITASDGEFSITHYYHLLSKIVFTRFFVKTYEAEHDVKVETQPHPETIFKK